MRRKINSKRLVQIMNQYAIKVVSIDKENMTYICDDGNEYPLMDGMELLTVDELQKHINNAKDATINILKQLDNDDDE
jgi:translation elongation factor P/translation initiation factor 5A